MDQNIKERWVAALRSGDYKQGFGYLYVQGGYCCLGVLCDLAAKEGIVSWMVANETGDIHGITDGDELKVCSVFPTREVAEWAEMDERSGDAVVRGSDGEEVTLSGLNDSTNYSFSAIADVIEAQL